MHDHCFLFQTLKEWVAVESDSIQPAQRSEVKKMVEKAASCLRDLGANVTLVDMPVHQVTRGLRWEYISFPLIPPQLKLLVQYTSWWGGGLTFKLR